MNDLQNQPEHGQNHGNHTYTIVVNGQKKPVVGDRLTFEQVVALDPGLIKGPNVVYTVTYKRGHGEKPEGTLSEGETVKLKEGMIFNVTATDKS
jgi:hypothetical protein